MLKWVTYNDICSTLGSRQTHKHTHIYWYNRTYSLRPIRQQISQIYKRLQELFCYAGQSEMGGEFWPEDTLRWLQIYLGGSS